MLDADTVLTTTRAVRKRLDLERPVERRLIEECLEVALQAPSGGNRQKCSFVVVTDAEVRRGLGELYRKGWKRYINEGVADGAAERAEDPEARRRQVRIASSARHLSKHIQDVPVLVIPCIHGRTEDENVLVQASQFGSVLPAVWSFMLAARARGLGTTWTTIHLFHEAEAAELLGIPYDDVMQVALIPVAHIIGGDLRPGPRRPMDEVFHWDRWGG